MSDFSKNVKLYRRKCGISQEGLAAQLNVTRQTVSNWENDKSYPDLEMVVLLAQTLKTDVNSLLYPSVERKKREFRPVSLMPVLITVIVFFVLMTFGGGVIGMLFQRIVGGGVAESYLYPLYGGIILLAGLVVGCTCVVLEELRNPNDGEKAEMENE